MANSRPGWARQIVLDWARGQVRRLSPPEDARAAERVGHLLLLRPACTCHVSSDDTRSRSRERAPE
jgi:hypothetical protein